jgi:hypothetical protein
VGLCNNDPYKSCATLPKPKLMELVWVHRTEPCGRNGRAERSDG